MYARARGTTDVHRQGEERHGSDARSWSAALDRRRAARFGDVADRCRAGDGSGGRDCGQGQRVRLFVCRQRVWPTVHPGGPDADRDVGVECLEQPAGGERRVGSRGLGSGDDLLVGAAGRRHAGDARTDGVGDQFDDDRERQRVRSGELHGQQPGQQLHRVADRCQRLDVDHGRVAVDRQRRQRSHQLDSRPRARDGAPADEPGPEHGLYRSRAHRQHDRQLPLGLQRADRQRRRLDHRQRGPPVPARAVGDR